VLLFSELSPTHSWDIWSLSLVNDAKPQAIIQTEMNENGPALSPNGRWMAYHSIVGSKWDIYVQAYPAGSGGRWRISTEGGRLPKWAQSGEELFYWQSDNRLMAVKVTADTAFTRENPVSLPVLTNDYTNWDVTADGNRVLVLRPAEETKSPASIRQINIVFNWFEELKCLCPTGK